MILFFKTDILLENTSFFVRGIKVTNFSIFQDVNGRDGGESVMYQCFCLARVNNIWWIPTTGRVDAVFRPISVPIDQKTNEPSGAKDNKSKQSSWDITTALQGLLNASADPYFDPIQNLEAPKKQRPE